MQQRPSSPSRTVAGGGAVGGGEDPFDGAIIPPEYLRWLLDDDDGDGLSYRATTAAEAAEASPRLLAAAPAPGSHSPMQRQASSPSCPAPGGGDEEDLFDDIVIPPDLLQGLDNDDDDGGCVHGAAARAGVEAEHERLRSEPEAEVGDRSPMRQPSSSCAVAGEGAGGDEDPFDDDIAIPADYLLELLDGDGSYFLDGEEAEAENERRRRRLAETTQACGDGGGCADDGLFVTYRGQGHTHVFDSGPVPVPVPVPHKVPPVAAPRGFDRAAAVSRYREKRKSMMRFNAKAGYPVRREITSRIARRRGKFAPSDDKSPDELQCCANCGESSQATPMMRRGPTGAKNFCNACGLAWANTRKIRKLANAESRHGGGGQ